MDFNALFYACPIIPRQSSIGYACISAWPVARRKKEVTSMFSGLKWYWWLVIGAALIVSVSFKVKFIKWWSRREQDKEKGQGWKWGNDK